MNQPSSILHPSQEAHRHQQRKDQGCPISSDLVLGWCPWYATNTFLSIFASFHHGIHPLQERRHRVTLWYETTRESKKCHHRNCPKLTSSNKKRENNYRPSKAFFKTLKELKIQICRTSSSSAASCHNSSQLFSFQHAATNACTSSCTSPTGRCSCIAKRRDRRPVSIKVRKAAR